MTSEKSQQNVEQKTQNSEEKTVFKIRTGPKNKTKVEQKKAENLETENK